MGVWMGKTGWSWRGRDADCHRYTSKCEPCLRVNASTSAMQHYTVPLHHHFFSADLLFFAKEGVWQVTHNRSGKRWADTIAPGRGIQHLMAGWAPELGAAKKVLLVDNETRLNESVWRWLEDHGWELQPYPPQPARQPRGGAGQPHAQGGGHQGPPAAPHHQPEEGGAGGSAPPE